MKPSLKKNDFSFVRRATLTFALVTLLSGALLGGSWYALNQQIDNRNAALAQRDQAVTQHQEAENETQEIRQFQPKYIGLKERGFIGEEKRLNWIEAIRDSQETRKLLPVAYEIAAQFPFALDPSVTLGEQTLYGSKMTLRMKLWHEMDLFQLLDDLKQKGFYVPTECLLVRSSGAAGNPSSAGLDAECKLVWLTLGAPQSPAALEQAEAQ